MKKIVIAIVAVLTLGAIAFGSAAAFQTASNQKAFQEDGYILTGTALDKGVINFTAGTKFSVKSDYVTFKDANGKTQRVDLDCFVHYNSGAIESFTNGTLLNFKDISDNFVTNYFIGANVILSPKEDGTGYASNTNTQMDFKNFFLKLSTGKYVICAPQLMVHLSENQEVEVDDFVEVLTSEDGIAYIRTAENAWTTIMSDFFIRVGSGTDVAYVYPALERIVCGDSAMSINKLLVSQEDQVVLSADETRRQIIPRINVEAIDGQNGSNGGEGKNGSNGRNGSGGESGTSGEVGSDGNQGSKGDSGTNGSDGSDGYQGSNGESGNRGGDAGDGNNVIGDSSTNSAIPVMNISYWEISSTGVQGVISLSGKTEALSVTATSANSFSGKVTITDVNTGEQYACYQCNASYNITDESGAFDDFKQAPDEVYFTSYSEDSEYVALSPDTGYRISVVAYYTMNNVIYSREFVSRVFYTDSTGVYLSNETMKTNSAITKCVIGSAYESSIASVEVYLLTVIQNESFTYLNRNGVGAYTQKITLDYTSNSMSRFYTTYENDGTPTLNADDSYSDLHPSMTTKLNWPDLKNDKQYIVRIVISTNSGMSTLSSQSLSFTTLKVAPTWTRSVQAAVNKANGSIEVWRPSDLFDADGGIVGFVYRAYQVGTETTLVQTQTVIASASDPVSFFLPSNQSYYFDVVCNFYDNEKTVSYLLGTSDIVASLGASLPRVTLTKDSSVSALEYNHFKGYISIDLTNASTSMLVNNNNPIELQIYADQIYNTTISLMDYNPVVVENKCTATYSNTVSNYAIVNLELLNLYKNTNYTITVTGSINLNDGNGAQKRVIGTVSFRTYDAIELTAVFNSSSSVTGSINKMLQLISNDDDEERAKYAISQLSQGQLTLILYSGTGLAKSPLVSTVISDKDTLAKIYGAGYDISEADFGNLTLNSSSDYTIGVTAAMDQSALLKLGYANTFSTIKNSTLPITAAATPPDLPTDPTSGVRVVEITNANSYKYGVEKNEELPDDALVGYALSATYDNVQRLASTITYYVMEYSQYFNSLLGGIDPVGRDGQGASKLFTMTQSFSPNSDDAPKVAVFFDGEQSSDEQAVANYYNGYYVYHAGTIDYAMTSGMSRGYRYVFAYTALYSSDGTFDDNTMNTYPYDHPRYNGSKYKYYVTYGAGNEHGVDLGKGVAYILNSGMYSAPKIAPEIHSYVYNCEGSNDGTSILTSTGSIIYHYRFRDLDGTITLSGAMADRTQIQYNGVSVPINQNAVGTSGWYEAKFDYVMTYGDEYILIEPTLNISTYKHNYNSIMLQLGYESEEIEDTFYLCHTPVEPDYYALFNNVTYKDIYRVKIIEDYLDENYYVFMIQSINNESDLDILASRAYGMCLTFTAPKDGAVPAKVIGPVFQRVTLEYIGDSSEYGLYCKVPSGLLGELIGREFEVSAQLYYDNGNQGVKIVEDNDYFGIQYINSLTEGFGKDNYLSSVSGGSSLTPNGALVCLGDDTSFKSSKQLEATLNDLLNPHKTRLQYEFATNIKDGGLSRYLYVDNDGIDASDSSSVEYLSGRYITFKDYAVIDLVFDGTNKSTLGAMTPVIQSGGHVTSTTQLLLSTAFKVQGASAGTKVGFAVYGSQADALALKNNSLVKLTFTLDENGNALFDEEDLVGTRFPIDVPNPDKTKTYWYVFFTEVNGHDVVLLDYSTNEPFTSKFKLITEVEIESGIGFIFYNTSYYEKHAEMSFSLSAYVGFDLKYDIFASEEDAQNGENALYDDTSSIIQKPIPSSSNNRVFVNLEPDEAREKLEPGVTYYFRIRVVEKASGLEVGSNIFEMALPTVVESGAVIIADEAGADFITFKVTVFDSSYSFMGPRATGSESPVALYAVRFERINPVTGEHTRLFTSYDSQVFSANTIKKEFVLNNECLTYPALQSIDPEYEYQMNIYAVSDYNHDGKSNPISETETDVHGPDYFFKRNEDSSIDSSKFQALINTFWDSTFKEDKTKDTIESGFLIASKSQKTTNENGLLLNESYIAPVRLGNNIQFVFQESYGLIRIVDGQEVQVFSRIEYSITGMANSGKAIAISGELLRSAGDKMFVRTKNTAGYNVYSLTIPEDVANGSVQITIKLYKTDLATENPITISRTYIG